MNDARAPGLEERVLLLCPTERDAALTRTLLAEAGIAAHVCKDLLELCAEIPKGVGALLLTEEVLAGTGCTVVRDALRAQAAWSDIPILLLAGHGADSPLAMRAMDTLGNLVVLEKPVRLTTLVSAARTALKARRRQYEVRDQLAALHSAEERLRLFVEHAPAAIAMFDTGMHYLAASRRWLSDYGVEGSVVGRSHYDLLPDIPERWRDVHRRALRGETLRAEEDCFVRADGSMQWLRWEARPWHAADGTVGGIVVFTEDITAGKHAHDALRESEARLRLALDAGQLGIWESVPATGEFVACDRAAALHGLPPDGCRTHEDALAAVHPDDRPLIVAAIARALETGAPFRVEMRAIQPDGSVRWLASQAELRRDGRHPRLIGLVQDITERKQIEEALRESDRRKDEFLATLAHELRNPLAPLRNGVALLGLVPDNPGVLVQTRDMMDRQVGQLVRLIDDLLDVSRISRGKITLRREHVNLAAVLNHAVETSRPLLERRRFELALPTHPIHVHGDPARLAQVFANLLNNASKFTQPGGRIRIAVDRVGPEVRVSVSDDGLGIPPEELGAIFDMFAQVETSSRKAPGGLGIGLALVKQLVELHGGSVTASSEGPGRGAKFVVCLPLSESPLAADAGASRPGGTPSGRIQRRVLVVDDNRDAALSLCLLLQLHGSTVEVAYDGTEALQKGASFAPEVVLLDLGMPGMDGFDTCRALRAQPWGKTVMIVALTGWGQERHRQQSEDAGFDAHLLKPIKDAELLALLGAKLPT